jgi:FkbM family methyltransferase
VRGCSLPLGKPGFLIGNSMSFKSFIADKLQTLGYEIIRKPVSSTYKAELSGVSFSEFLDLYLKARGREDFFFVQVGANDGVANDVIHEFAVKLNLNGLVIEPQAAAFRALKANYAQAGNLLFENVAISKEDGEQPLYTIRKDLDFLQYVNQAASFRREHTVGLLSHHIAKQAPDSVKQTFQEMRLTPEDCIEAEMVKTFTFRSLLNKRNVSRFDFLQVDTEGFDFEVLKMAEIEKYRPSLINYEHEHLSAEDKHASWDYLRQLSYRLFTHQGETAAYCL